MGTRSLISLPIFPDETVYSWLVRQVILSGFPLTRAALEELIGPEHRQLTGLLPGFAAALSSRSNYSIAELLREHTALNYYRLFTHPLKFKALWDELKAGHSITLINQHGWLATLSKQPTELRYCPICASSDYSEFGVAFWHVEHQLPGCIACAKHGAYLVGTKRWRNMLELPPQQTECHPIIAPPATIRLARLSQEVLQCKEAGLLQRQLALTYRVRLAEQQLATATRKLHIDQNGFRTVVENSWQALALEPSVASILELGNGSMFPKCMAIDRQPHHPLRHLLVIGALFSSIEEMLSYYRSWEDRHQDLLSLQKKRMPRSPYEDGTMVETVLSLLEHGHSMNAVARHESCNPKIIKRIALQHDANISRNPKFLHEHERRAIWRKLCIGHPSHEIAKSIGCSRAAVDLELSYYPELKPLRKRIQYFQLQQKHRNIMLENLRAYPGYSRTKLQKLNKATYSWLYKNDRDWLHSNLPPAIPISERLLGRASKT